MSFSMKVRNQSRTLKAAGLMVFLALLVSAIHFYALPPGLIKSYFHIWRNHESFIGIVELFEETKGVGRIQLQPDGIVGITQTSDDMEIDWDADALDRVADLLRGTKVLWVERRSDYIYFFGGEDYKLGSYFQARVVYGREWEAAFQHNETASCFMLPLVFKSEGGCLDFVSENLALHYVWVDEIT